jgi:ABC-type polysaccharide/polyol phosphate transport system ATPase subunit
MNAVELKGVGKRYQLGGRQQSYLTIREALASFLRSRSSMSGAHLWALRNIDLEIPSREIVGIVGRNGAGKSTLLKLITGITAPTTGVVRTRGRVGALLEVGTGFHPELTGRENVYLNAAVLGMARREARHRFDEIVAFAGVEDFIDTPLKRYSTGMRLRLAFAVAAYIRPPIIVVDEVLAVADAEFQRRCLGKMAELGAADRTVIFVSHDLGAIARLCRRVLWIDGGVVMADGPADEVIGQYLAASAPPASSVDLRGSGSGPIELIDAATVDERGSEQEAPTRDKPLRIKLRFAVRDPVQSLDIAIVVRDRNGVRLLDEAWSDTAGGVPPRALPNGEYSLTVTVPPLLAVGNYVVAGWFGTAHEDIVFRDLLSIEILPRADDRREWSERLRALQPPVTWDVTAVGQTISRPGARS